MLRPKKPKSSPKLVFFGTEDFSLPVLRRLIIGGWNVVCVVTKPDTKAGRGRQLKQPAVKAVAEAAGLKLLQPARPADIYSELANIKATHGVLSAYGKIIPQTVLDLFPGGIINIHPSLLPKYRGPSPIETAILNGDKTTGISLMRLSAGMDEGPVYAQEQIDLPKDIDARSFSAYLAEKAADFLLEKLAAIVDGSLPPKPQDNRKATYTKLLKKEDGIINWHKPATELERQVRAFAKWPRSRAHVFGHEIIITKARVVSGEKAGALVIKCRPGWLEIMELIAPSGRSINGEEFIRGYRK